MQNKPQIILGIDPGLAIIGFAVVDFTDKSKPNILDLGAIITDKGSLPGRLVEISEEFEKLIKKHKPDLVVIEQLVFVKNVTNGLAVAHARGVLLAHCAKRGMQIKEVLPKDVKIAVCGYGNAPKIQVQNMVQRIFNLSEIPKPDDVADALAVAYSGIGE